jgi:hypothetical protein
MLKTGTDWNIMLKFINLISYYLHLYYGIKNLFAQYIFFDP